MSANAVFAAVAVLLLAAVLALLLLPLLRRSGATAAASAADLSLDVLRDQLAELDREVAAGRIDAAAAQRERMELERRALEDGRGQAAAAEAGQRWRPAIALALIVPLVAGGAYWQLGSPAAIGGAKTQGGHALGPQQIQAMAARLAERLQQNPADGEGWLMLGRSYAVLGRHAEAAAALGRAAAILPPDANMLADYADVLAMAQGRRLAGDPEKIVARALEVAPRHVKALALSGTAAFERQDYARAIGEWEKILAIVPPGSNVAQGIGRSLADARSRLGQPAQDRVALAAEAAGSAGAVGSGGVGGVVSIDARLTESGSVKPGDTVYVFARSAEGKGPPLAMLRMTVAQLPARFMLDDRQSMLPGARISTARQVIVGARVAKSGTPQAAPGDFEGLSGTVAVGAGDIRIVIAKQVQ